MKQGKLSPIVFYYPNLIGYVRILLSILTVAIFPLHYWGAALCYTVSQSLDAVDGHVARAFNQASLMGASMDQLTDRMSTVGTFLLLAAAYPHMTLVLFLVAVADIAGHWIYVHAQALRGSKSHKNVPPSLYFLKVYYENKSVMFICHLSYETLLFSVLMLTRTSASNADGKLLLLLAIITVPLAIFKFITNVYQLFLGASLLIQIEEGTTPVSSPKK
eukprot:Protomagalhaensia_sp_Gyna_25__5979@NODE_928_length_2402_cov_153_755819_g734_i0_p2_GENE_NODE_928_length_2402_cov_153_755819_g734_i0NODE_928_length_2402_cov_153_755819_g734_i0_p2_ORF_typecomplete_len218_score11_13CDPOH_P_transf/PF01066_21/8_4e13CDPOH_P_transf/PF01066_21/8_3e03_NODE_928_length_2402_cov_153_755819_g734_i044697